MTRTAGLRARGIFHQAAFDRTEISLDVPLNRCVFAALREVEHLSREIVLPSEVVATARALGLVLADCLPSVIATPRPKLAELAAQQVERGFARPEAKDVASLASAVLDTAGFGGNEASSRTVERAWFVNLETFFEAAVRRLVRHSLKGVAEVSRPLKRPSLFNPDGGRYRANPDIVISDQLGTVAIADAKYKDFTKWPSSSDVHEVLAHASAYGAKKAILFFPDESGIGVREFGEATTGCQLWAVGLSFDRLSKDIERGLKVSGVKRPVVEAA